MKHQTLLRLHSDKASSGSENISRKKNTMASSLQEQNQAPSETYVNSPDCRSNSCARGSCQISGQFPRNRQPSRNGFLTTKLTREITRKKLTKEIKAPIEVQATHQLNEDPE
jgi:hypothetical protein